MLDSSQPWSLFGYDLRGAVHYVRAGWSDFLWGDNSRVLPALDEVVVAHTESGEQRYFKAGQPAPPPASGASLSEAVILPDRLALIKTLQLPLIAEANLASAIALEVSSSSPFPSDDTCFGWRTVQTTAEIVEVCLVISSKSAVLAYIAEAFASHEPESREVWALVDNRVILIEGFGESGRRQRNRNRLGRVVAIASYCAFLLIAASALAAGTKYLELQKVREIQADVEASAEDALGLREGLASARSMINAASNYIEELPSPQRELKRLAQLLGDDTWVSAVELRGKNMRVEGQSSDASAVMQLLLEYPAYESVEAPVAIKKLRSGEERFVLDVTLKSPEASE